METASRSAGGRFIFGDSCDVISRKCIKMYDFVQLPARSERENQINPPLMEGRPLAVH